MQEGQGPAVRGQTEMQPTNGWGEEGKVKRVGSKLRRKGMRNAGEEAGRKARKEKKRRVRKEGSNAKDKVEGKRVEGRKEGVRE